jgi:hypothetical protein
VATRRTTRPLGASGASALSVGTLDGCFPSYPGPVSSIAFDAYGQPCKSAPAAADSERRGGKSDNGAWIPLDLKEPASNKATSATSRALVRIALAAASDAGYERLAFKGKDEARTAAVRLVDHPVAASILRALLGYTGPRLVTVTTERLLSGELKILWRRREPGVRPAAAAPARPPPPTSRPIAPASRPAAVDSTFPPDLDADAVAQSLKNAAADGVPFCEECMKAQAARNTSAAGAA